MSWRIVSEPVLLDHDPRDPARDVEGWVWRIARGDETREITVFLSGSAMASTGHPSQDLAKARETLGRNYVEAILDRDEPPRYRIADSYHTLPDNLIEE